MPPKMSGSSGKSGGGSGKGQLKTSKMSAAPNSRLAGRFSENTKWSVAEYKPVRKISDEELKHAKKIFSDLDTDLSGHIDVEELGIMLRSLGQNPTEDELKALIVR